MTVPHADPMKISGRKDRLLLVGAAAWAIFFGSLTIFYLVSFRHGNLACQRAAGLGLGVALASGLLALPAGVTWSGPASAAPGGTQQGDRRGSGLAWMVLALLAAGATAVIWIATNLAIANQPAGAWALAVPATAAPLTVLLSRIMTRSRPQAAQPVTDLAPVAALLPSADKPAIVVEAPAAAAEAGTVAREPGTVAEEPSSLGGEPEAGERGEARESELISTVLAGPVTTITEPDPAARIVQDATTTHLPGAPSEGIRPGSAAPEVTQLEPTGLLHPGWESRLGDPMPGVALDAAFWRMTIGELSRHLAERGGVAFTRRWNDTVLVLGAVFPEQVQATSVFCEFSTAEVERARRVLDQVANEVDIEPGEITVTWVHTHPRLGVFLSGTDLSTARNWRALNPDFTPIVIDASKKHLHQQIGVFDASGRQIRPVRLVDQLTSMSVAHHLRAAFYRSYQADGLPRPLILIPGPGR